MDSGSDFKQRKRAERRELWETRWADPGFSPKWAGRGIAREIIDAVESAWLPARCRVLDIGCGLGETAAWFARKGYQVLGFDIAEAAVRKARQLHSDLPGPPEFIALDVCAAPPPGRAYDILVDTGCLHQIPQRLIPDFVRNIASVCAPNARMILFMRAYRCGRPFAATDETLHHADWMRQVWNGVFHIERYAPTYLNPYGEDSDGDKLPGIVFWMSRIAPA